MSLCQIWPTLHEKEEQLAWSVFASIFPRLCRHAHLWNFGNAHVGATVRAIAARPARVPREPSLREKFTQTLRRLEKFTTSNCVVRMGVPCCENHISRAFLHRNSGGFWSMIGCWPPSCSRGSGLLLTVDERVSICGRQRLHPRGHRLHMPFEASAYSRVSFMASLTSVSATEASSHFCS